MSLHLAVYDSASSTTQWTQVNALPDIVARSNNNYLFGQNMNVLAATAVGSNLTAVRINTPSLRSVVLPQIRPINSGATVPDRPKVMVNNYNSPIQLKANEEVKVEGYLSTGTTNLYVGLILADTITPAPVAPVYTLRGTASTTLVADTWTQIDVAWDDTLAAGQYALVGLTVESAGGVFCRAYTPGTSGYRPGGLCINAIGNSTHPVFEQGNLGTWLTFNAFQMFVVEMVSTSADTSEVVYAQICKIG